jgi:hypothetical protein
MSLNPSFIHSMDAIIANDQRVKCLFVELNDLVNKLDACEDSKMYIEVNIKKIIQRLIEVNIKKIIQRLQISISFSEQLYNELNKVLNVVI